MLVMRLMRLRFESGVRGRESGDRDMDAESGGRGLLGGVLVGFEGGVDDDGAFVAIARAPGWAGWFLVVHAGGLGLWVVHRGFGASPVAVPWCWFERFGGNIAARGVGDEGWHVVDLDAGEIGFGRIVVEEIGQRIVETGYIGVMCWE